LGSGSQAIASARPDASLLIIEEDSGARLSRSHPIVGQLRCTTALPVLKNVEFPREEPHLKTFGRLLFTVVFFAAGTFFSASAFAADLTYSCNGMWAAPAGIMKAFATVSGSFSPSLSQVMMDLTLDTGAHFTGAFKGAGPDNSTGVLRLAGDPSSLQIAGDLRRVGLGDNSGFRFNSPEFSLILSCHLN
jgi:hypothetical protein